jgi:hypothetical protein
MRPTTLDKASVAVSGFHLGADSTAAQALREWKAAGGTYRELIERALEHYAQTEAYRGYIAGMEEGQ